MRKIDADELIKTIEKVCFSPEWARFRADFGSRGERDYIIREIVNAPTIEEKTGEWIPVSERLPDYSGLYLVSIGDLVTSLSFDGVAFNNKGFRIVVNAWQPLPEPYKEEKNG